MRGDSRRPGLAGGQQGALCKEAGCPSALHLCSPGSDFGVSRRGEAPHPSFCWGAHLPERGRPAPWGRLAAGPAAPGRWAARFLRSPGGNRPGGQGRGEPRTDGRGPRAAADGCEAGLGPETKAKGRCSRPDVRGRGGLLWEKPTCLPAALPPRRLRAGGGRGEAGIATGRGSWEAGSPRQGLRGSLVEAFYP